MSQTNAIRRRDLRLVVAAVGVSSLGDFLLWVPLMLHLERQTGSGLAVAGLLIALWAPVVVLAPVAGLLVDRTDPRRALIVASLAQAVVAASLAFALGSTAAVLALTGVLGVGFAVSQPAEFALLPRIARGARLAEANGRVETARYVGMTAGPLLGGALAAAGATELAMLVNAATFAAVAAAATLLRTDPAAVTSAATTDVAPTRERARDGIVFLRRDRLLAMVIGVAFVSLLFMTASQAAWVFFIQDDLGAGDAVFGSMYAAWTAGMVAGALVLARRLRAGGPQTLAVVALAAIGVQGLGLGLPTACPAVAFTAAMFAIGGVAHGTKNVAVRTLIQDRVPERLHGRAFAAYNGLRNAAELIALAAGGVLVAAVGGRLTLAVAGGVPVLVALAGLARWRARGLHLPAPTVTSPALALHAAGR